jgi:hypothetical protein
VLLKDVVESAGTLTHGRATVVGPEQMQADTLLVGPSISSFAWGAAMTFVVACHGGDVR